MTRMTDPDLINAQRIAAWNLRYGPTLGSVTSACGAIEAIVDAVEANLNDSTVAELQRAGRELARACNAELAGSRSGVPDFDGPRVEALRAWSKAGTMFSVFDPRSDPDSGFDAGILLARGTEIDALATAYVARLVAKFQP